MQTRADLAWRVAIQEWSNDGIVELLFGLGLFSCAGIEALRHTSGKWSSWWLDPLFMLLMYAAVQLIPAMKVRIAGPRGGAVAPPGGYGSSRTASMGFIASLITAAGLSLLLENGVSAAPVGGMPPAFAAWFSFIAVALALSMAMVFFVCSFRFERRDLLWLAAGSFVASIWMYWIRVGIAGCMLFFMAMGGAFAAMGGSRLRAFLRDNPQITGCARRQEGVHSGQG